MRKVELDRKEGTLSGSTLLGFQARLAAFLGLQPAAAPIDIPLRTAEQPLSQSTPAAPSVAPKTEDEGE